MPHDYSDLNKLPESFSPEREQFRAFFDGHPGRSADELWSDWFTRYKGHPLDCNGYGEMPSDEELAAELMAYILAKLELRESAYSCGRRPMTRPRPSDVAMPLGVRLEALHLRWPGGRRGRTGPESLQQTRGRANGGSTELHPCSSNVFAWLKNRSTQPAEPLHESRSRSRHRAREVARARSSAGTLSCRVDSASSRHR